MSSWKHLSWRKHNISLSSQYCLGRYSSSSDNIQLFIMQACCWLLPDHTRVCRSSLSIWILLPWWWWWRKWWSRACQPDTVHFCMSVTQQHLCNGKHIYTSMCMQRRVLLFKCLPSMLTLPQGFLLYRRQQSTYCLPTQPDNSWKCHSQHRRVHMPQCTANGSFLHVCCWTGAPQCHKAMLLEVHTVWV